MAMEALLKRDVNFMCLSGMQRPDYNAINLFRKHRLADVMDDIFTQVVQMLVDAKFVSLEVQYIDGTKVEANANKYTFIWKKATKTNQDNLDLKVKEDAMNNGQTKPGYNVQIATKNQFITNYGLYHQANDQGTMIPFLKSFSERYG